MVGFFRTTSFYFLLDQSSNTLQGATKSFSDQSFDARLTVAGLLPDRNGAPLGSWIIARLARLTNGRIGPYDGETLYIDGGSFCLDLLAYDEAMTPVATLQFQGSDWAAIFGECRDDVSDAALLDELATALLADPTEVRDFRIVIKDPEQPRGRVYGYDGSRYLQ